MNVAAVKIDLDPMTLARIKYVLIGQNRDVAIAPSGTVTASAAGFVYLGSQVTLNINQITAGTANDPGQARIRTQGNLVDDATGDITVGVGPVSTEVTIGDTSVAGPNGATITTGTITRADGQNWGSLGYAAGEGIFIASPDLNGEGQSFTGGNYYTIGAISGDEIVLQTGQALPHAEANATVGLAPVTVSTQNGVSDNFLTPAGVPTTVTFSNVNNAGVITLASGKWASLGYSVGDGIFVGGIFFNGVSARQGCQQQRHHLQSRSVQSVLYDRGDQRRRADLADWPDADA